MFDINVNVEDIRISSIERQDIVKIQKWINYQNHTYEHEREPLGLKEFYERFLEYYVSENEFFLKITKEDNLIGILKGRIEFKNLNEVWIWYFIIDNKYRRAGYGSRIIKAVESYFWSSFGINNFYTGVCEKDSEALRFWNRNQFKLVRVSKEYFNINGRDLDMLVLKYEI